MTNFDPGPQPGGNRPYLGDLAHHLPGHRQALDEGAGGDEGAAGLELQVAGHVAEGPQRLRLLGHALQVLVADGVLRVGRLERALQQPRPQVVERLLQIDGGPALIPLQLPVQVLEDVRVLGVERPVDGQEGRHRALRSVQQLQEIACG